MNRAYLTEETALTLMSAQEQREADYDEFIEDECSDPDFAAWCVPAQLKSEFADPDMSVRFLREHDPIAVDSDDQIYLTQGQESNKHDRVLVDVLKRGRRKGGTHGLAPENRRRRSAKIVNPQLLRWNASASECTEAEGFYHTANAKIARSTTYVLSEYKGKHGDVLEMFLQGKNTLEIAETLGKSTRRVRQIVNGHAQRTQKGLRQIINEALANGVPSGFSGTAPVAVATSASASAPPPKTKTKTKTVHQRKAHGVQEVAA